MQRRSGLDCIGYLTDVSLSAVEAAQVLSSTPEEMRAHLKLQIDQKQRELNQLRFRLQDLEEELEAARPAPAFGQLMKSLFSRA